MVIETSLTMPKSQNNDDFYINEVGYTLMCRLVQWRMQSEIDYISKLLENEKIDLEKLKSGDSWFRGLRTNMTGNNIAKYQQDLNNKEIWFRKWSELAWDVIENKQLLEINTPELITQFLQDPTEEFKLYLILQEAVLTPVFGEMEGFPKGLSEENKKENLKKIAEIVGFHRSASETIYKRTEQFLKNVKGDSSKFWTWTIVGSLAIVLTAGLAAPAIAGAIGGLMGLHGAAAMSAGLAFLGGGALATGGLGMAGGVAVLIGGGALIGALGGGGLAKAIGNIPPEAVALSMVKITNYIQYLTEVKGEGSHEAKAIKKRIIESFLNFKHDFEREISFQSSNQENTIKHLKIIHFAFETILKTN